MLQCSEDALVVWVGAGIFTGRYGGTSGIAQVRQHELIVQCADTSGTAIREKTVLVSVLKK